MAKGIYINGAAQISIQKPLSDEWLTDPIFYDVPYVRAIEADYRQFIEPMAARRMGRILKRATATSMTALAEAGLVDPDAVITGTGLGCIESTEKFLSGMIRDGEELLQPTNFMNSTHNTISSQIAVQLKCHGYNNTYAHLDISFESALMDAFMQLQLGRISTALVGAHDEMTPDYFKMLGRVGYWKDSVTPAILYDAQSSGSMAGETAVSMVLSDKPFENAIALLRGTDLLYKPSAERLSGAIDDMLAAAGMNRSDIDIVITGKNGDHVGDTHYEGIIAANFPEIPTGWYKHIFGESYTSAALGMYAGARLLQNKSIPAFMMLNGHELAGSVRNILLLNHYRSIDYSLILLSAC